MITFCIGDKAMAAAGLDGGIVGTTRLPDKRTNKYQASEEVAWGVLTKLTTCPAAACNHPDRFETLAVTKAAQALRSALEPTPASVEEAHDEEEPYTNVGSFTIHTGSAYTLVDDESKIISLIDISSDGRVTVTPARHREEE